jgi:hypothetical protein
MFSDGLGLLMALDALEHRPTGIGQLAIRKVIPGFHEPG